MPGSYVAASAYSLPFGLRALRVKVGSTNIPLSPVQTLEAHEVLTQAEISGEDAVVAVHSFPVKLEGTISAAGLPLAAYALITGRTIGSAGVTPTRVNTMPSTKGDIFPYFLIYGRSVADDGGDVWMVIYKAKLTDGMTGSFDQGQFRTSGLTFTAVPDSANGDKIFDIVQHETAIILPTT